MAKRATRPVAATSDGVVSTTIGLPNAACARMASSWALVHALRGRTEAMRAGKTKWLPMHRKEDAEDYAYRLARSHLHSGYVDTVDKLGGKPFIKAASISEKDGLPPRLQRMVGDDVDNEGDGFDAFWKRVLRDSIDHGLSHVLVDMPPSPSADAATEAGLFPYLVHVPAANVRSFKKRKAPNGETQLVELVYVEPMFEVDPKTGTEREREYLREWRFVSQDEVDAAASMGLSARGSVVLWRRDWEKAEWTLVGDAREISYVGAPVLTHYTRRVGFMEGEPALQGLADLNLEHWQSSSDQRNILHVARSGIIAGFNLSQEDIDRGLVIGPNYAMLSRSSGSLGWVEHSGAAVAAGRQDLLDIEARMETKGLQPLLERAGEATATSRNLDADEVTCELQEWVRDLETAAEASVRIGGRWVGDEESIPEKFAVDIFNNFALSARTANDAQTIIAAKRDRIFAAEIAFRELRRRGFVDESVEWEENKRMLDDEGPALGDITADVFGGGAMAGGGADDAGMRARMNADMAS